MEPVLIGKALTSWMCIKYTHTNKQKPLRKYTIVWNRKIKTAHFKIPIKNIKMKQSQQTQLQKR